MSDTPQTPDNRDELDELDDFSDLTEHDQIKAPRPKKRAGMRPIWVTLLVIGACFYVMWSLRGDLSYYFTDRTPADLGSAVDFEGTDLPDNSYVTVHGIRHPGRGIKLSAIMGDVNVFPLMGTAKVYVETLVETDTKGEESLSRSSFSGRLRRFASTGIFDTVRDFSVQNFGKDVDSSAILVMANETPGEMWSIPLIYGILLVILAINIVWLIRRLVLLRRAD